MRIDLDDRLYNCKDPQLPELFLQAVKEQYPNTQIQKINFVSEQQGIFSLTKNSGRVVAFRPQMTGFYTRHSDEIIGFSNEDIRAIARQIGQQTTYSGPFICKTNRFPVDVFTSWWDANDPFILDLMKKHSILSFCQIPDQRDKMNVFYSGTDKHEINDIIKSLKAEYNRLEKLHHENCSKPLCNLVEPMLRAKIRLTQFLDSEKIAALLIQLQNCFDVPFMLNEDFVAQFGDLTLDNKRSETGTKLRALALYGVLMAQLERLAKLREKEPRLGAILDMSLERNPFASLGIFPRTDL